MTAAEDTDLANLTLQEQRRYTSQISTIGTHNQKLLNQSKVAVVGLCGIGISASDSLLRTGLGNLVMIDASLLVEEALPSISFLGSSDVGKLRCVAVRDHLRTLYPQNKKIEIFSKLPYVDNVDKIFNNCTILIDTCRSEESTFHTLDYADKHQIPAIVAFSKGGIGSIGFYGLDKKETFRELLKTAYSNNEMCECQSFCYGFATAAIGNIVAGLAIRYLFNMLTPDTNLFNYDFLKDSVIRKEFL